MVTYTIRHLNLGKVSQCKGIIQSVCCQCKDKFCLEADRESFEKFIIFIIYIRSLCNSTFTLYIHVINCMAAFVKKTMQMVAQRIVAREMIHGI